MKVNNPVPPEAPLPACRDRIQGRTPGTVPVRVVVEHPLHVRLQGHHRHRLRDPVSDTRNAESPGSSFLGYLHRPDRTGEIRSRRHAVPQSVEVIHQIHLELRDRHTVGPGRSSVLLHVPHESLDWDHAAYMPGTTWAVNG